MTRPKQGFQPTFNTPFPTVSLSFHWPIKRIYARSCYKCNTQLAGGTLTILPRDCSFPEPQTIVFIAADIISGCCCIWHANRIHHIYLSAQTAGMRGMAYCLFSRWTPFVAHSNGGVLFAHNFNPADGALIFHLGSY